MDGIKDEMRDYIRWEILLDQMRSEEMRDDISREMTWNERWDERWYEIWKIIMMIDQIVKDDRVELVRFETMGYDMVKYDQIYDVK